ncbi:MAG: choice-of-anchor tandem repeat GloVer-containing protein [Terriglobales bacterium]
MSSAKVLYNFHRASRKNVDGTLPQDSLISDSAGNLYGTTVGGGAFEDGTVFELTLANGSWTETVLHSFSGPDGSEPWAGLTFDASGNLYGTTVEGGPHGNGVVFELISNGDQTWTEKILFDFYGTHGKNGEFPAGGLIFDAAGNLYGTTRLGGVAGLGTVFELMPTIEGNWKEKLLHHFNADAKHGSYPLCTLAFDAEGNLYGTTSDVDSLSGPTLAFGTVFELSPTVSESWKFTILHKFTFDGKDGFTPVAGVILDSAGSLYGTTLRGGIGPGIVYELMPKGNGSWTEKILRKFKGGTQDGANPFAGVTFDATGNLYGTTMIGGTDSVGTVFELSPALGGGWTEQILHKFKSDPNDGNVPYGGVILDSEGNLYGTTIGGGDQGGGGTVYEIPR